VSGGFRDERSPEQVRLDVVEHLRLRRPEALEAVAAYMLSSVPGEDGVRDAQLTLGWSEVAGACLDCGLLAIEHGEEWSGPIPPIVVIQERRAARDGIDLSVSVARYITAYRLAWDFVLEELADGNISDRDRTLVLRRTSTATMSLLTQLLAEVTQIHFNELKHSMRTSAQNNAGLARRILTGERVNGDEIDYDFDAEHIGVIGWGDGATKALAGVADRLGYQRWIVSNDDGTVWAWLCTSRGCMTADIKKALGSDTCASVFAAIGDPAEGLAGFRDTHGLAQAAYLVAQLSRERVTQYADVAREAHALQDPLHTKWLMRTYITPVIEHHDGASLLRTLEKFYEAAHVVDKTAKLLGIGRHTVERHLDKIGQIIGRDLRTCHTEMELALRLAQLHDESGERTESSGR
jgi:PucR C-terminal helix-turn-helix domain/GGDEF-like domain